MLLIATIAASIGRLTTQLLTFGIVASCPKKETRWRWLLAIIDAHSYRA
jgi:hypothetical protein